MKRIVLAISLLVASGMALSGQGRVAFNNYISENWIYVGPLIGPQSQWVFAGSNYSIQLLWAPGTYSDQAAFNAANPSSSASSAFWGVTGTAPEHGPWIDGSGTFEGGLVPIGTPGFYTMQARGWYNGGQYPTFGAALGANANVGLSLLFSQIVTAGPGPAYNTIFPSFTIWTVPEPSAFSLVALYAAVCGAQAVRWALAKSPRG
jgi:hypothetical protein